MLLLRSNYFWLANLYEQEETDAYISSLDPLDIDDKIELLPELNRKGDIDRIIRDLYIKMPLPQMLQNFSYGESIACMRDLGMYIGSIKRHGMEPVEAVPELDYILDVLSTKTNMPPRDTLLHYAIWNPAGARLRTYTQHSDEKELIKSVKISMVPLLRAIHYLIELYHIDVEDPQFEFLCGMAGDEYKGFIDGVVWAKRKVSPLIFARELRLYFDPIRLYNQEFIGPGAVEMPLFVFDHILWGADIDDQEYKKFSETYVPYNLPGIRDIYYHFCQMPSLVTKICQKLNDEPYHEQIMKSAKALHRLCKLGRSFRVPHKKLADEAYKNETKSQRQKGSGGYSTALLSKTLELNTAQCDRLLSAIEAY